MRTIKLNVNNNIYNHVIFLLKSLNRKDLEIFEDKEVVANAEEYGNTMRDSIKKLFEKKTVEVFESIKDPVKWQEEQRSEW